MGSEPINSLSIYCKLQRMEVMHIAKCNT